MKQVNQFAEVLVQVLLKKKKGNEQQALQLINEALKELNEDSSKAFNDLNLEETVELFTQQGHFNWKLALTTADLLYEECEMLREAKSEHSALQALLLYRKARVEPNVVFPLEAFQKIKILEHNLVNSPGLNEIDDLL
ncbi:MAG: hypothetical protein FH748_10735 [Balneolaceae bacterium]|nr:hypothetical protein [Balneolaceae bacterium]